MKFIKEHLFAIFALIVLAIILAGVGLAVYLLFYSEDSDPYNTRLTNIEQYPIDLKKVNEVKEKLFESGVVESVNYVLEGKLINFDIDVKRETKLAVAKEVASKVLESFTEEQLAFYDVHIIISNNAELKEVREKNAELEEGSDKMVRAIYPVFGSKHKTNKTIRWTK